MHIPQVCKGYIPLEWEFHFPAEEEYHIQWGEILLKGDKISQELHVCNLQDEEEDHILLVWKVVYIPQNETR